MSDVKPELKVWQPLRIEGNLETFLAVATNSMVLLLWFYQEQYAAQHMLPIWYFLVVGLPLLAEMSGPLWLLMGIGSARRWRWYWVCSFMSRFIWIPVLLVPLLPSDAGRILLLVLLLVSSVFAVGARSLWQLLIHDSLDAREQQPFLTRRTTVTALIMALASIYLGWLLNKPYNPWIYVAIIEVSVVLGVLGAWTHRFFAEPAYTPQKLRVADLLMPYQDTQYLPVLGISLYTSAGIMIGWPFIIPWLHVNHQMALDNSLKAVKPILGSMLNMIWTPWDTGLWFAVMIVFGVLGRWFWAFIAEEFGNVFVLRMAVPIMGFGCAISWFLSGVWVHFMWISAICYSLWLATIEPTLINITYRHVKSDAQLEPIDRLIYLSQIRAVMGFGGILTGIFAGFFMDWAHAKEMYASAHFNLFFLMLVWFIPFGIFLRLLHERRDKENGLKSYHWRSDGQVWRL